MKYLFTIVGFILFNATIFGQIGEGIVRVHYDLGTIMDFYSDTSNQTIERHID